MDTVLIKYFNTRIYVNHHMDTVLIIYFNIKIYFNYHVDTVLMRPVLYTSQTVARGPTEFAISFAPWATDANTHVVT
jgi:hypothetical protein